MRIALFSDVHGNLVALKTLLEHLRSDQFDAIYCLGDLFTPYPGSAVIWELVKAAGVECILGNNEVALVAQCNGQEDYHTDEVRFRPFLKNVEEIKPFLHEIQAIPAFRRIKMGKKRSVLLCHYSPGEVFRGLHSIFEFNLEDYLEQVEEEIVITGHLHNPSASEILGKQVYCVGSVGLPLKGNHQMEFAEIEERDGKFRITFQLLPYPFEEERDYLILQRFPKDYGPIAWLAFDEILTQQDRIVPFLKDYLTRPKEERDDYYAAAEKFMRSIGRWEEISNYI